MKASKIIFLDIDGVLNISGVSEGLRMLGIPEEYLEFKDDSEDYLLYLSKSFSPTSLYYLSEILKSTQAKIVISSTWRRGVSIETMRKWFQDPLLKKAIIDKTPSLSPQKYPKLCDKRGSVQRGEEIYMWLQDHPEVTHYAVIDDDGDMDAVRLNFFQTNSYEGLTHKISREIIAHLNKKEYTDNYRLNCALQVFYQELLETSHVKDPEKIMENLVKELGKKYNNR